MSRTLSFAAAIAAIAALSTGAAQAQVTVSVTGGTPAIATYFAIGNCMDVGNANVIMHATCQSGRGAQGWRFVSGSYGMISLGNQTCLQSNGSGAPLTAAACNNGTNQRWGIQTNGELRNELGLCADIEGGNRSSGGRVVGFSCHGGMNQKWYAATSGGRATYRVSSTTFAAPPPGRALVSSRGVSSSNIVAGGAGNIVAGGAGNIVAGGAGNIVAGGAGNIIAASIVAGGAGNIVAGGAGNLIANDGASLRSIAAGSY